MRIDDEKLIRLIGEELDARYPILESEIPIGSVKDKILTIKIYSKKEADYQEISEPNDDFLCIFDT
jgi:hypothetical protein